MEEMKNEKTIEIVNSSPLHVEDQSNSNSNGSKYALTTEDNPYDPFNDFNNWLLYDNQMGYGTCSYLARIARTSDSLSEKENNDEIERAIDEIVRLNLTGLYKKVKNPNYKD